jgi:dodecin
LKRRHPNKRPRRTAKERKVAKGSKKADKNGNNSKSGVAKVIEISSSSSDSIEDAVQCGIAKAGETLEGIEGVWLQDVKGVVRNNKIVEWRVHMKVTFVLN